MREHLFKVMGRGEAKKKKKTEKKCYGMIMKRRELQEKVP
jgi:hypothetical protein